MASNPCNTFFSFSDFVCVLAACLHVGTLAERDALKSHASCACSFILPRLLLNNRPIKLQLPTTHQPTTDQSVFLCLLFADGAWLNPVSN